VPMALVCRSRVPSDAKSSGAAAGAERLGRESPSAPDLAAQAWALS